MGRGLICRQSSSRGTRVPSNSVKLPVDFQKCMFELACFYQRFKMYSAKFDAQIVCRITLNNELILSA